MTTRRHVVVVGAGSAGCVVAERLSRADDVSVTLLEAGPGHPADADLDLARLPIEPGDPRARHLQTVDGPAIVRGRGLGGSSVVNGGYFLRGHRSDFDGWDPRWWDPETIARWYDELDGGGSGGTMSVRRFDDDDLHPRAHLFESYWRKQGFDRVDDVWPRPGVIRVPGNRTGGLRRSADRAYLRDDVLRRSSLRIRTGCTVGGLSTRGERVRGVRLHDGSANGHAEVLAADEVILCAGTLATVGLLGAMSGADDRPLAEHREILVRYRDRGTVAARARPPGGGRPVLPTVVHTDDGVEIRCYNGDLADHIRGVPVTGPAIGVARMRPAAQGRILSGDGRSPRIDLGDADGALRVWAHRVAEMLDGAGHAELVEPGSVVVDPHLATSQHASGTLAMGSVTDWLGRLPGVTGLRVVDGSILPTAGSSGPHATVMMVAARIADVVARER